jgi:hypothetical protein
MMIDRPIAVDSPAQAADTLKMKRRRLQWPPLSIIGIHAHFAFVAVVIVVMSMCGDADGQTNTTTTMATTTSFSTHTPSAGVCPAVTACLNDTMCAKCLRALGSSINGDEATKIQSNMRSAQTQFFFDLIGPTCSSNGTVMPLVEAAGHEINSRPCHAMGLTAPVNDPCLPIEFDCSLNPQCRQCLLGIFTNDNKTSALSSPSCSTLVGTAVSLQNLSENCFAFPKCTFAKQECANDATLKCTNCLNMVRNGDVTDAVQECSPTTTSYILLDKVATNCLNANALACNYHKARCDQNAACVSCLTDVGGAHTKEAMARLFLDSSNCMSLLGSSPTSVHANQMLDNVFSSCPTPEVTVCQFYTFQCILQSGVQCATCLADSVSQQNKSRCEPLVNRYTIDAACEPCSSSVFENNRIVLATSVVGGVSTLPCLLVIVAIVAYGKDQMYIRARIIIGLMLSNIVYSIGNAIPVAMLQTNVNTCGLSALSFNTIRFGRAWWFAGKYTLVFFEIFILGVALWALKRGIHTLGVRRETLLHTTCAVAGISTFVGFFVKSGEIESGGYNSETQAQFNSNEYSHISTTDDLDDDAPYLSAGKRFTTARNKYDTLVQRMLQVWIAFLVLCILLWFYLRYTFARLTKRWHDTLSEAEEQWDRDLCASDLQGVRKTKRRFLELTKEIYDELFRPLEPFVAVFIVFGVPAFLMATDFCNERSQVSTWLDGPAPIITVGKCDVVCELVLSFRSIATVAVYFCTREHRTEIYHIRTLWRRLHARVTGWFQSSDQRNSSGVRFRGLMLEQVKMIPRRGEDEGDIHAGDVDGDGNTTGATVPYKLMDDDEGGDGHYSSSQL